MVASKTKTPPSKLLKVALNHANLSGLRHPDPSDQALEKIGMTRKRWCKLARDFSSATLKEVESLSKLYNVKNTDLL